MVGQPEKHSGGSEKTVFFCQRCGFGGDMSEDFVVERSADAIRYRCPECTSLVVERPVPPGR